MNKSTSTKQEESKRLKRNPGNTLPPPRLAPLPQRGYVSVYPYPRAAGVVIRSSYSLDFGSSIIAILGVTAVLATMATVGLVATVGMTSSDYYY